MCWACPFSQERRRCHGGRKRVARSLSFSQVCARCHGGRKAPKGCLSGAGELASGKRERTHYIERALFAGAPPLPWREKARCAEFVLFTGMRVVMARKKRRRDAFPAQGSGFRENGRRRIAPGASLFTGVRVAMARESAEWISVQRMETLPEKREKARCAGHVLFHSYIAVAMARESAEWMLVRHGKAGESVLR